MIDIAAHAREIAQSCEAKKHALRQTQDGIVVSFVLHPSEVPAALQLAPLGTRYMLALVEIGDDEQPKPTGSTNAVQQTAMTRTETPPKPASADTPKNPAPTRAPRKWEEITPAQQAGIRCNEPTFVKFLAGRYRQCVDSTDSASQLVRELCEVQSRSDIRTGTKSAETWTRIEQTYQTWLLAERVGAI